MSLNSEHATFNKWWVVSNIKIITKVNVQKIRPQWIWGILATSLAPLAVYFCLTLLLSDSDNKQLIGVATGLNCLWAIIGIVVSMIGIFKLGGWLKLLPVAGLLIAIVAAALAFMTNNIK